MMSAQHVHCCIAGGGPAGLVLGVLLARAGLQVAVLEKHADFLRDFRGDTIHPSTLQVMSELGWLAEFLELPHQKVTQIGADYAGRYLPLGDFTGIRAACPYIALMPQWDFLSFLAGKGRSYAGFELRMNTEAIGLVFSGDRVTGVKAVSPAGKEIITADLVVAADGRGSVLRERAGLKVHDLGAPIDVLWFKLPRKSDDPAQTMARFESRHMVVLLNRGDYWQCAYIIAKGDFERIKAEGLHAFRADLSESLPFTADRLYAIASWYDVKLLSVRVDRLETWWRDGFLCIGDAAHAMSPVGGVGINLAVQDAVAASNILFRPLGRRGLQSADLAAVQRRRLWPTRLTQAMQVAAHRRLLAPLLKGELTAQPPLPMRVLASSPMLRGLLGRTIGIGVRPEHVSPAIRKAAGTPV